MLKNFDYYLKKKIMSYVEKKYKKTQFYRKRYKDYLIASANEFFDSYYDIS